ncbi:MAG: PAS-domain containing protein [Gemmatimonadetes bacterium]|nr:PAS-domain containing protein [Gemmatimonadota bacterium]
MNFTTRLFLGAVATLLISTSVLLIAADRWLRSDLEGALEGELEREARLVAAAVPHEESQLNAVAHRYGALLGRRVSLIDRDGQVLGDSDFDDASLHLLGNHRGRPEVEAALAGRTGIDSRTSASTHRAELKVAVPAWPGIVRISTPLEQVDAIVHTTQQSVLVAALIALLFGIGWAGFGGRWIGRPLAQLGRAARALAAGDQPAFPASRAPEIRQLTHALRSMDDDLRSRIGELRRRHEETETLIESMVEGVIAADREGNIVICNSAARRLLAYPPQGTMPNARALFHERAAREIVEQALAGQIVVDRETDLGGQILLFTARPLPKGGAILVLHDVTALKRLEVVRRDFVANVSHELKTPLTSISGYADTLLADEVDESTRRRFLEVIGGNAHRMQRLVDDLLDLARLESGGWKLSPGSIDLEQMAREAWAPLADRASQRGIRLVTELPPDFAVTADPDALREVLINLFENSIRHTSPLTPLPAGEGNQTRRGEVMVSGETTAGGAEIRVTDTGSGIPAEHLPRIFERFYRVDPGRSREEGGTGLGLSIVKHLVEAHGGRIQAESALGKGTTMRMFFPSHRSTILQS